MPKPNPLTQGLEQHHAIPRPLAAPADLQPAQRPAKPARSGRVLIGGHFAPQVQTALKIIAAEERTTMQALLTEAINTVFAKRRKPEIADIATN
jgi:hypothetical protein